MTVSLRPGATTSVAVAATRLDAATAHLDAPLLALDLGALRANAADLVVRAAGTPVRVASKSVRCRAVLDAALGTPGFRGVMAYAVREAVLLARAGVDDVLLGYPSVDRGALAELAADPVARQRVTLMVDDPAQLRIARDAAGRAGLRVCIDVDASLRIGPLHLGVRRSPVRTPSQAAALASAARRLGFDVVGVMFYEAQVAGLPDSSLAVRLVKRVSIGELAHRRAAVVAAVAGNGQLEIVNSGGTGSLESSAADPVVTEVTAGSGLYGPTLFDGYRAFTPRPALMFALPVVRRPAAAVATTFGGGYIASGPAGASRVPTPVYPAGLRLLGTEGAGEVQTPVRGRTVPAIGDRVWWRHTKAGEICERFTGMHLVEDGHVVGSTPTYRGEGWTFG
ncbi:alanine racemase [Pseudonocardia sp. N23]|uniref:alanine racemase n=1 Tax=Pseudonocardia sp. N23 TaxID=1987376 RepID=UPI000BFB2055|nr:alanine racemase [Pseudonocardia sp. N23]GAY08141.1 L-gulono-1,4-lactone oxidase [Pseudonocardia sp. N23]